MAVGDLTGRTALVTGASRGIGAETAATFAARGANVVLCSRKQEALDEVAEQIRSDQPGAKLLAVAAHAADEDQASAAVDAAVSEFGSLDILVNNAGTNPHFGPVLEIETWQAQKTFEVNELSLILWTRAAARKWMSEHGGAVVNIASIGGMSTEIGIGFYNATKSAVIHLTRQLAYEMAPNIRINAIAPGLVRTKLAEALWKENEKQIAESMPLRRLGEPEDIAKAAAFLVSDESTWMTGQTLVLDGGALIRPQIA